MLKKSLKHIVIGFTSSVLLVSCATTEPGSQPESDLDYNGSDCISIRTIRDYTPLDRKSLIIEGSGNRLYYVTLVMSSFELRTAHQIGVQSRDSWLCPYGGDRLILDSFGNESVGIRGIMRLSPEQADDLLIRYGKKEPPGQQDPTPPELEGAEVEELGEIG